ncbi:MAG TPA: TIGR03435 family protein, partial [Candidatus Acidoferrum sp.]|nr:TIGR03435 family protein [Candidatus Acidoferrum sp.]
QNLQQMAGAYIDHPIVDSTGLSGGWDFLIGWTPKAMMQPTTPISSQGAGTTPISPQGAGATVEAADPNGITVFDALERELGLKLVKQKRSIPIIVVDHVDEKPIE